MSRPGSSWSIFMLFFGIICGPFVYGETRSVIELNNSYGGTTTEVIYAEGDENFQQLVSTRIYTDSSGVMLKSISRLNEKSRIVTGITFQEEQYLLGKATAYKMYFSEEGKKKRKTDYMIEQVDGADNVITRTYGFGDYVISEDANTFASKYPFQCIAYIFAQIFEVNRDEASGDKVTFSGKFNSGRSLIRYVSEPEKMNDLDKRIAGYYFKAVAKNDGLAIYNTKVNVAEDGTVYTAYIQDSLVRFLKNGNQALITFVVIGFNHQIYPIVTSILDK